MLPDVVKIIELPCITTSSRLQPTIHLHGALMIMRWGSLFPAGMIIVRYYKHRPNTFWFTCHRAIHITGLVIILTDVFIAIINFTVLSSPSTDDFFHEMFRYYYN